MKLSEAIIHLTKQRAAAGPVGALRQNVTLGNREVQLILDADGLLCAIDCTNQDQLTPRTDATSLVKWLDRLAIHDALEAREVAAVKNPDPTLNVLGTEYTVWQESRDIGAEWTVSDMFDGTCFDGSFAECLAWVKNQKKA